MDVLSNSTPTARKSHICMFCGGIIAKGKKYRRQVNIIDGEIEVFKCHEECQDLAHRLDMYDDCDPDYGLTDEMFCIEIDNYIDAKHYDMETEELETEWHNLTRCQQVLKILEELKSEENENNNDKALGGLVKPIITI